MEKLNTISLDKENQYKNRLTVALKAARICIYEVDLTNQLYTFFENAEDIFGITGEEILEAVRPFSRLSPEKYRKAVSEYFCHPDDGDVIEKAFENILSGRQITYTARMKTASSKFIWCKLDVVPIMENGKPVRMIGVITDISDMKRERDMLEQKTYLDGFTGLRNKNYSISSIKTILECEKELCHALILADIDNFKYFNDTYGHADGDKIIAATARKFAEFFHRDDIVGRFGGDEFIILVRNIRDFQNFKEQIKELTQIKFENLSSTNSLGIAIYPNDGTGFEQLFKKADDALYKAKKKRKKVVFAQPSDFWN